MSYLVDSASFVLMRTVTSWVSACFNSNVNYKKRYGGLFTGMQMRLLLYQRPPRDHQKGLHYCSKFKMSWKHKVKNKHVQRVSTAMMYIMTNVQMAPEYDNQGGPECQKMVLNELRNYSWTRDIRIIYDPFWQLS